MRAHREHAHAHVLHPLLAVGILQRVRPRLALLLPEQLERLLHLRPLETEVVTHAEKCAQQRRNLRQHLDVSGCFAGLRVVKEVRLEHVGRQLVSYVTP